MAKDYKFYACYKNSHNGGIVCEGRNNMEQASKDLIKLINTYVQNDLIFIGVIKCKDGNPLNHIYCLDG